MATLKTFAIDGVAMDNAEVAFNGEKTASIPSGKVTTVKFDEAPQLEPGTWYAITLQANFPTNATNVRFVQNAYLSGSSAGALLSGMRTPACQTGETILTATAVVSMTQGVEYIARVYQGGGSAMNVRFTYRIVKLG